MDGDTVDDGSRRELLAVEQPYDNHNGGDIHLGPDGFLYVALGDGGSAATPRATARTPRVLGSILRIDPTQPADEAEYGIPDGNLFADGQGGAPEIWLYGVRNPWRFSFDRETGDLWIGDVGQDVLEEIDLLPAADGGVPAPTSAGTRWRAPIPTTAAPTPRAGAAGVRVRPVRRRLLGHRRAVPGRGHPGAHRRAPVHRLLHRADPGAAGRGRPDHRGPHLDAEGSALVSFGEDPAGEVYVLSLDGPIYRIDVAGG